MAVLNSTAQLAHNPGMSIVAERIENADQIALRQSMHCQFGQGYHFSKPLAAADGPEFLRCLAGADIRSLAGARSLLGEDGLENQQLVALPTLDRPGE